MTAYRLTNDSLGQRLLQWLRTPISPITFVALFSLLNIGLYHQPLLDYVLANIDDLWSLNGLLTLFIVLLVLFVFTIVLLAMPLLISRRLTQWLCILFTLGNSIALFFINAYGVILDKAMMGNVQNTRYSEAVDFLQIDLLLYLLLLGVVPALLLAQVRFKPLARVRVVISTSLLLLASLLIIYFAANTWLWIDKHSKQLGGRILPWSYLVNSIQYYQEAHASAKNQILLPAAHFTNPEKTVVLLVVGETARAQNFAFYGYQRNTNPLLAKAGAIALRQSMACSTYTTASVGCILSHTSDSSVFASEYEPLPSYLQRQGVETIWRSNNWGEPPLKVGSYLKAEQLRTACKGSGSTCGYDEVLLSGLAEQIKRSNKQKIVVILHQKGSHGPKYNTRYPSNFERFTPVCSSVELQKCSSQELINAYDNTILYNDYFLDRTIKLLQQVGDELNAATAMLYISDHGESLGEYGLYLHGTPYSLAPDVQKEVPFIVWFSDRFGQKHQLSAEQLAAQPSHSHSNIFHSVIGAIGLSSEIYRPELDIFNSHFNDGQ